MRESFLPLDNAAKIYPAAKSRNWTATFRIAADLTEAVELSCLRAALARVMPRFPQFAVRLRRGLFWYYLEPLAGEPEPVPEGCCPCLPLRPEENGGFSLRVLYYENHLAVEFFHVLTDGTGGMCFFKTLLAEYLTERYGCAIPRGGDILDCAQPPRPQERADSFLDYAGSASQSRRESNAFRIRGIPEADGYVNVTCGMIPADIILGKAREKGVTLTQYLAAVLIMAIYDIQRREVRLRFRRKPIKIFLPVNLRRFFPSETLRNFSSYVTPGIEPAMGQYDFDEVLRAVYHQMGDTVTEKKLRAKFTTNVRSEQNLLLRLTPLVLKSPVMKLVFHMVGDRKSSSTITNLGAAALPAEMAAHVPRLELILGPLNRNPVACAALSYGGTLYLNFTRTITDAKVERAFFRRLIRLGIPVKVESNARPAPWLNL